MNYATLDATLRQPHTRRGVHHQGPLYFGKEFIYDRLEYDCEYRKIANNTYIERRFDHIAIRYHITDIAEFYERGYVRIRTGGWPTSTTAERLNLALAPNFSVWRRNRKWWIMHRPSGVKLRLREEMVIHFETGKVLEKGRERVESEPRTPRLGGFQHMPARCHVIEHGRECGLFLSYYSHCARHGRVVPGDDLEV